ncbi:MAG: cation diffusion facilitator family transporter [Thalassotalea sp.]|nr:cation diffusion facilitator family transporter [Thalassotalea sp.]
MVIKFYAWLNSGAAVMLASGTDSFLDILVSIINLILVRYALAPPDKEHRFGHGKAESLAGLVQAAFIAGSATLLVLHGVERVVNPVEVQHTTLAISVTLVTIALTLSLVAFQLWVVRKTQSIIVAADSLHYRSDLLLNAGVLVSLLINNSVWQYADGTFTILVGLYLFFGVTQLVKGSLKQLMDHELSADDIITIKQYLKEADNILGYHQLKTRQAGAMKFVQLHIELADNLPLVEAHRIADDIENSIAEALAPCEVIVHMDPCSVVQKSK